MKSIAAFLEKLENLETDNLRESERIKEVEGLREQRARDEGEILALKQTLQEAEMKFSENRLELKRLTDKAAADKEEVTELKQAVTNTERESADLKFDRSELQRLRCKVTEDKLQLAKLVGYASGQKVELKKLRQQVTVMHAEKEVAEMNAGCVKVELVRLTQEVVDAEKKLKVERSELVKLRARVTGYELEVGRLKAKAIDDQEVTGLEFDGQDLVRLRAKAIEDRLELTKLKEMEVNTVTEGLHLSVKRKRIISTERRIVSDNDFQILVTSPSEVMTLNVKSSFTIAELKLLIHSTNQTPRDEQKLTYEGEILEDSRTLDHYDIEQNSGLVMEWSFLGPMNVLVQDKEQETISLDVRRSDTIAMVKTEIYRKSHKRFGKQWLTYKGKRVRNDHTLADIGMEKSSTLNFHGSLRLEIFVKDRRGETIKLQVKGWDVIASVKGLIHKQSGTPILGQRLEYEGNELRDDEFLAHYPVEYNSTVDLVSSFLPTRWIKALATTETGQVMSLEVKMYDTVARVKSQIESMLGTPIDRIEMIVCGVQVQLQIDDIVDDYRQNRTLSELNLLVY